MKFCDKCQVSVAGDKTSCPLCQQQLSGEADGSQSVFPYIPSLQKQFAMLFKLAIFIGVACAVLAVGVNLTMPQTGWWSIAVVGGIVCYFVSVAFAINKWSNPTKNIIYQVVIVSGSTIIWDYFTGWNGWSINFVMPIICVSAMITMAIISKVLKLEIEDSILYWIIGIAFGLVPIVFLSVGVITVVYPSVICISISLILLAAFIIFEGKHVKIELRRRFHI